MNVSETKKTVPVGQEMGRYDTVVLSKDWIDAVKDGEDYREIGQSEIVKLAVDGVRAGEITRELVDKIVAAKKKAVSGETTSEKKAEKSSDKGEK
jgi:hypothetical protein